MIHDIFHDHDDTTAVAETIADSITVGQPRNTVKACKALEESGGSAVLVSDEEILTTEKLLGSTEGIYAEPAGAAPIAGVRKARAEGLINRGESIVVVVTGHGLKDAEAAPAAGGNIDSIAPDIDDVIDRYGAPPERDYR